jgi:hypothetical protein
MSDSGKDIPGGNGDKGGPSGRWVFWRVAGLAAVILAVVFAAKMGLFGAPEVGSSGKDKAGVASSASSASSSSATSPTSPASVADGASDSASDSSKPESTSGDDVDKTSLAAMTAVPGRDTPGEGKGAEEDGEGATGGQGVPGSTDAQGAPASADASGEAGAAGGAGETGEAGAPVALDAATGDPSGAAPVYRADIPRQPVERFPDVPSRSVTIWQGNARYADAAGRSTVYEFSVSTRGSSLGELTDIVFETDHGRITVPGPMDSSPDGGYRTAELVTDEYVDSFTVKKATATVNGVPDQDILPYLFIHDYQPMPVLLPGDPPGFLDSVRYYEIPKIIVDAPVVFGDEIEDPPRLYISDFVEAAVQIYQENGVNLLVFNGATLVARPSRGPYITLHNRDGMNGFSVREPSGGRLEDDTVAFSFMCRVTVHPVYGPEASEPEVTSGGVRQDMDYALKNNPIIARAFTFG